MSETYEEMLHEAENRIPFYSKTWNNFLPSDPGNTILEILTWFQAKQREKLQEIPEEVIENLLRMAGFERKTEEKALLYVKPENAGESIPIVKNQKFYTGHLCFEAEETVARFQGKLQGIYRIKNQRPEELLELKEEVPVHTEIFGVSPKKRDAVYFLFDALPDTGKNFSAVLYADVWQEAPRNPFVSSSPFARLSLEIYNGAEFVALDSTDDTYAFLQSGEIRFQCPKEQAKKVAFEGKEGYLVRCKLTQAGYDVPPSVNAIYGPLLRLRQKDTKICCRNGTVTADSPQWEQYINLGILYGYDCQEFDVSEFGKIDGSSLRMWAGKNTQRASRNTGSQEGAGGLCPSRYALEIPPESDGFCYEYDRKKQVLRVLTPGDCEGETTGISTLAVTEGALGNIRKNNCLQTVCGGREVFFRNPVKGKGGQNYESLEQMKKRFHEDMKTPQAAVTEEDCEKLARKVPGLCVRKTHAYVTEDACLHVVVMPYSREEYPALSDIYRKEIGKYLEERKLLNTKIRVKEPRYVKVDVQVKAVQGRRGRGEEKTAEVQKAVEKQIDCRMNEKPIGAPVSYNEILEGIKAVPGILSVRELEVSVRGAARREVYAKEAVVLPQDAAAVPGEITVELSG